MRNYALIISLLLCSNSWISVSCSESQIVEVQPGRAATLLCSNFSSSPTQMFWFRVVNRSMLCCVSSIYKPPAPASYCDGFKNGNFEMTSNMSTLFLRIRQVDLSDHGLYFCGYYIGKNPLITSASYLQVQEVFGGITNLMNVILGSLTVLLAIVITYLAVRIKMLQKAHVEEEDPQCAESHGLGDLTYAVVTFRPKTKKNHTPASEEEVEPRTIYSATRQTQEAPGNAAENL